jgi:hypothetical protein
VFVIFLHLLLLLLLLLGRRRRKRKRKSTCQHAPKLQTPQTRIQTNKNKNG